MSSEPVTSQAKCHRLTIRQDAGQTGAPTIANAGQLSRSGEELGLAHARRALLSGDDGVRRGARLFALGLTSNQLMRLAAEASTVAGSVEPLLLPPWGHQTLVKIRD